METEKWSSMLEACNAIINDEVEQIQAKVISILLRIETIDLHEIEYVYTSHFNQEISPKISKFASLVDLLLASMNILPIIMDEKKLRIDFSKFESWIWSLIQSRKFAMAQLAFGFSHDFIMPTEQIPKIAVLPEFINAYGNLEKSVEVKILSAIDASKVFVSFKYRDHAYKVMMSGLNYFLRNNHASYIPPQICDVKLFCAYYCDCDNVYYRALIIKFNADGTIWVNLIDCGVDVLVKNEYELRMLPREFAALEQQAFCVSLHGIQAINEESKLP
ncbi:hypothetical protein B4U80_11875, partial [Leptotrombidium deliense]